jgi:hypothetical protein
MLSRVGENPVPTNNPVISHQIHRLNPALATGISLWLSAALLPAAVYSGVVDIAIPTSYNGVYLNLGTGGTSEPGNDPDSILTDTYTIGYSAPAEWDVNFFFGGIGIAYSPTFRPFVDDTVGNRSQILNVATETVISTEAAARSVGVGSGAYGGSGRPNGSTQESHFDIPDLDSDPRYSAFTPGQVSYIAFVLNPGPGEQYGWMEVTLTNNGTPGTIHRWAYSDDVNFEVGQIPEPGSLMLWLLAATTLLRRRRRR